MAVAKKCDLCGALYEYKKKSECNTDESANGIALVHNYYDSINYFIYDRLDCCPDCMHSIQVTIKLLKEKGEENEKSIH